PLRPAGEAAREPHGRVGVHHAPSSHVGPGPTRRAAGVPGEGGWPPALTILPDGLIRRQTSGPHHVLVTPEAIGTALALARPPRDLGQCAGTRRLVAQPGGAVLGGRHGVGGEEARVGDRLLLPLGPHRLDRPEGL